MNNIYVDELPKNCFECVFCDNHKGYCDLQEVRILRFFQKRDIGCPLKLISDRLAEERKKVIERIRDLAEIYTEPSAKGFDFDTYILTEENLNKILDKAERGSYINVDTKNN